MHSSLSLPWQRDILLFAVHLLAFSLLFLYFTLFFSVLFSLFLHCILSLLLTLFLFCITSSFFLSGSLPCPVTRDRRHAFSGSEQWTRKFHRVVTFYPVSSARSECSIYFYFLVNVLLTRCARLLVQLGAQCDEIFTKFLNSTLIRLLVRMNAATPNFLTENSPIQRFEKASGWWRTAVRSDLSVESSVHCRTCLQCLRSSWYCTLFLLNKSLPFVHYSDKVRNMKLNGLSTDFVEI